MKTSKKKPRFKVTLKHRRFIRFYIQLGNISEAGRLAGFNASYARDLVSQPAISNAIQAAQHKAGLSDELLLKAHVELITQTDDKNVRLGAIRLGYQVNKKIGAESDSVPVGPPPQIFIIRDSSGRTAKDRIPPDPTSGLSVRRAHQS